MTGNERFVVYASGLGNSFFEEMRDLLACGLRELGLPARTADEAGGFAGDADWHVVVAPHEFFLLGAGSRLRRGPLPRRLVFYGAEQPGSRFYSLALQLFPRAAEVWHLDQQAAGLLAGRGLACRHVPLGFAAACPLFKPVAELPRSDGGVFVDPAWRRRPAGWALAGRPIDVFFAGSLTDRRRRFFARHAGALARHRACLRLADERNLIRPGAPGAMAGRMMTGLEQRSKIVLNVHADQALFFEWHRIALHGLGQRCLVVTEPTSPALPLKPGRDFVEAAMGSLPAALDRFLLSERGRRRAQEIADQGFETFSAACRMADFLRPAVEGLARLGRRRARPGSLGEAAGAGAVEAGGRASPTPFGRALAGGGGAGEAAPAAEKASPSGVAVGSGDFVDSGGRGRAPKVTVAVSVYNYRRYLRECLDSVAGQTLGPLDLVVVDDGSTDGSAAAARGWLARRGRRFRRWTLVRRSANAGLSAARNAAFSRSRTPFVFVLDADNSILPPCLERLCGALGGCRADFAYSYLSRFGEEEGLSNVRPWDPSFLKTRAYLDAMALLRLRAWERAGGYDTRLVRGWEDYDFWLRLARVGGRGVLLPEVLGRYRVHLRSMLHTHSEPQAEVLRRRFLREHRVTLDADNVPQDLVALNLFGGQRLPIRVEAPSPDGGGSRRGRYLVAALSILRDLNGDLISGGGPSGRRGSGNPSRSTSRW
ncbi:MAG: glycosyltransferase family 2 protein [Elusimicrobia bacterium]|nr:glycosyltransferase family 2 protein [Elusimicrobiota bacterium]